MAELINTPLYTDANLRAYYRFEGNYNDSSSYGLHLGNTSNNSIVSGRFGQAVSQPAFPNGGGSNADSAGSTGGGAYSIVGWMKMVEETASGTGYNNMITYASDWKGSYHIIYDYNGGTRRLRFLRTKWSVANQGPSYNIALGTTNWYHLALTYDTTNLRGYVNGTLVAGPTSASGSGSGTVSNSVGIGSCDKTTLLDDVAFFNRCLDASEIKMLAVGWTPGPFVTSQLH